MGTTVSWTTDGQQWHEDNSENVSTTGMLLRTGQPATPGSTVKLSFRLPNLSFQEPVLAEAEVARVVQRNGRQIGLGLRFLTLGSNNYEVVNEFVCRILGLTLDGAMVDRRSGAETSYSFEMEKLLRHSEERKMAMATRRLAEQDARVRQAAIRLWLRRGLGLGLLLLGLFAASRAAGFFISLIHSLPQPR